MPKTFLKICQDVLEEAGLSGGGPTSVTSVVGIEKRIVGWVRQAWIDVQQHRSDWPWMQQPFVFTTSPGKDLYSLAELNILDMSWWNFAGASVYKTADGKAGERPLAPTTYNNWWFRLRLGLPLPADPHYLIASPMDCSLRVFPEPDAEYTITLAYMRVPQQLTAATDIPLLPVGGPFEEIIKWKALLYYAYHDGAPDIGAEADLQYSSMIHALDNRYGQQINMAMGTIA